MLKGNDIGLRPLVSEDVWLLYKWFNDKRVLEDLGSRHSLFCVSLDEERRIIEKKITSSTDRDFIIVDLAAGRAVGWASLSHIDQRNTSAELHLIIGETSEWGKGLGKEATRMLVEHAFNVLNLHRIYLRVTEYNKKAIACFAACGFQREGTMRDDHYHMGAYMSSYLMSVLRPERKGTA
jgi:RimJ/RimL family protein N-acetyltransferase